MIRKFTLILLLFAISASNAQWVKITTLPNNTANSVYFLTENYGFAGSLGSDTHCNIAKTTDGGATWTVLPLPNYTNQSATTITSIYFSDMNHGIVATENPNLSYKTADAGLHWTSLYCGSYYPGKVYFRNSQSGFYFSDASFTNNLTYTYDSGQSWIPTNSLGQIKGIHFPNTNSYTGYMLTSEGIYKTTDSGFNWTMQSSVNGVDYSSIYFITQQIGFRTSKTTNQIDKTIDGGVTWQVVNIAIGGSKIWFTSATVGYIAASNSLITTNEIYKTTDQGETWQLMTTGDIPSASSIEIQDFSFPTAQVGYALSSNGYLYKLDNNLGIDDHTTAKFSFSPNPAVNTINFDTTDADNKAYTIFDLTGKQLSNGTVKDKTVHVSTLQKGIYLLKFSDSNTTIKFQKQ